MANFYDANGTVLTVDGDLEGVGASISTFKKIGVIGDSFASGTVNVNDKQPSYIALSWPQHIARLSGVSVENFTAEGLSTRTWLTNANGLSKLLATEAQGLYILALGINDDNLGASYIGTIADIKTDYTKNADTFYGNYGKIVAQIQVHAPGAKLVMLTLTRAEPLKPQLDAAIAEIANHFGIPTITVEDDEFFTTAPFPLKTGHPTVVSHGGMAKAITRLVEQCMVDNVDYFADYADNSAEEVTGDFDSDVDVSALFYQAPTGSFSFSNGGAATNSNGCYIRKNGAVLLGSAFGFRETNSPGVSSAYGYTNWFPAGENLTTASASDFCVVGDEIWCFGTASDDNSTYGVCWRMKYDPVNNELLEAPKFFWHNFGHVNAVNYNPVTDSLIMGNGSADYSLANKIYIIRNVSAIKEMQPGAVISLAEYGTVIDASGYDFGVKLNVVWANNQTNSYSYNTNTEYIPNIAYAYADDMNRFYILAMGYDTYQYPYGTYVEPTDGTRWNGTYAVLKAYQIGDANETIGNPGSYSHCGQGGDALASSFFTGLGHSDFWIREVTPENATTARQKDTWFPGFNVTNATVANRKVHGIAVTNEYLIVGYNGAVCFIPR